MPAGGAEPLSAAIWEESEIVEPIMKGISNAPNMRVYFCMERRDSRSRLISRAERMSSAIRER